MTDKPDNPAWQPIETAPMHVMIDLWTACAENGIEHGWRKTGELIADDPHLLIDEDGRNYSPHENGGWFTHWMPLPAPPADALLAERQK